MAYDYYKDLTFIEEVIDIRLCEKESDIETYIYGMEKLDRRFMLLAKNDVGEWTVYGEGR